MRRAFSKPGCALEEPGWHVKNTDSRDPSRPTDSKSPDGGTQELAFSAVAW